MKIGFADTCLNWTPHFETDLELIEDNNNSENQLYWFNCNGELPFCQANPFHKKSICSSCKIKKKKGLSLVDKRNIITNNLFTFDGEIQKLPFLNKNDIDVIKAFKIDQFDIGLATFSSLVSVLRNPQPDLEKNKELIDRIYSSAYLTYSNFEKFISSNTLDLVYIFNGRYAVERAFVRICEKNNIKYIIHERGGNKDKYMLFENSLPHNRVEFVKRMHKIWETNASSEQEKIEIGKDFYLKRMNGVDDAWLSYTSEMKSDTLPKGFDSNKINISIFTSSEDELAAISDEWKNQVYNSQLEGIQKILNDSPGDFQFYLRIHPNLIGVKNNDLKSLLELSYPNLEIIQPNSSVNTYSLIKSSNKVIVFGSTVGIESVYLGIPSILAGQSFYSDLNATYNANSHNHLIELVCSELKPTDKLLAIKYGYYIKAHGFFFKHYKADNLFIGTFKGQYLYGNFFLFWFFKSLQSFGLFSKFKVFFKKYRNLFKQ
jgi:hypothetical protein